MGRARTGSQVAVGKEAGTASQPGAGALFLTTLWFGLVAGWVELGLVLAQRAIGPRVSVNMPRTNRHFVWMVPVSDLLIFGVVALAIVVLARFRWGLARWTAWRLPVAMSFLALLLTIEGLYPIASTVLACGLASKIGSWLERRAAGFSRVVRASFPAMAVSLVVLTGLTYERVTRAEHRALSFLPSAKPGAPNVLLIVLDTVRAANMSFYGHNCPTTPNLDRLARKGILFSEARSTAPWTLPSHASMMTGRWPHELSAGPDTPLDRTFPTLAEALGREGYATAGFVGNVFYCDSRYGLRRGFARYEATYENRTVSLFEVVHSSGMGRRIVQAMGYPIRSDEGWTSVRKTAAMINRDVLAWLARKPADRPFFAFVNYYDAHRPYALDWGLDLRFGMAAFPLGEQLEIDKRLMDLAAGKPAPANVDAERIVSEGYRLYHDSYDSCIAYLDRHVGLLIDEIERRGLLENTLVIVTSDHGEQFGEHGLIAHGASLHRTEVHVPFLLVPPAPRWTAKIVDEPVSLRDIPATVAECVDLGARNPFPGRSLARFLSDDTRRISETPPVRCELQHNMLPPTVQTPASFDPVASLVSRDRVYIRSESGREELYDLLRDPFEAHNLARYAQFRPDIDEFRAELDRLRRGGTTPAR